MNQLLVDVHHQEKVEIANIIKDLHDLTIGLNNKSLSQTISDLRERINDPFMFVIVGEVKAGKSSFINALLESDICGVAPQPFTDTIQQISYGAEESIVSINEYFKKIKMPIEILKDIAIVDTPGTNAIIAHHQELTERFIPSSDLIVFVFEAKNPYRQSSWDFFDFIQDEWKKKIVFVLQQKDLLPQADLDVNMKGVKDYAIKKGISDPNVFAVSAKMEIERDTDNSGFLNVRKYIQEKVTGGKAAILKLRSNIDVAQNINNRLVGAVLNRKKQYLSDVSFRQSIKDTLQKQEAKSIGQVDSMVSNMLAGYDQVCYKTEEKIRSELGFISVLKRSFSSMFSKSSSLKEWFATVETDFSKDINFVLQEKLNDGIFNVAESLNQLLLTIDAQIQRSETILKDDEQFFSQTAKRRESVLLELKERFSSFMEDTDNFKGTKAFGDSQSMAPDIAKGGGMVVIGIVLTSVTNMMVFDITGGIISAIGLLFAGVSLGLNKSKVIKSFKKETDLGRGKIKDQVTDKLNAYIKELSVKINDNFSSFDELLQNEKIVVEELESKCHDIASRLGVLEEKLV